MDAALTTATAAIEAARPQLIALSEAIHGFAELGFEEVASAAATEEILESAGFTVDRGVCDLPTAFDARVGSGALVVAFMAEYDALPEVGHACGHNLIAASSVGASSASRYASLAHPPKSPAVARRSCSSVAGSMASTWP